MQAWTAAGHSIDTQSEPGRAETWTARFPQCVCPEGHHTHHDLPLKGRIDTAVAAGVRKRLFAGLEKASHVRVSLAEVTYLDTSGVAVLVEASRAARARGVCLSLTDVAGPAKGALELAHLERFFPPPDGVE